jgi:crotonobetainyl-CoA:carnitine CoA-transferase CaiB-like acyl-CoA transferase
MQSALSGIRVLDVSRILAAPLASQMLGDLGADVVKVERPGIGDDARSYGPPFLRTADGDETDEAGFYLSCNRNKRSITVDHSTPEGADILRRLASESDVFIENFRPGVLKKYGLDYDALRQDNPSLIYCSVTGFGQDGPLASRPGYDGIFQAMSGMMSVSGVPDGEPGAGPMKVGVSMVDILTSLYATNAILAALHHREVHSGEGQHIDMSLLECGVAALSHYAQNFLISGVCQPRRGNGGFGGIPSQAFACADGEEIFLVASTPHQWTSLVKVLGRPDLADHPDFATVSARIANRDHVLEVLTGIFATNTADHWVSELETADVPISYVNDMHGVFANPQIIHRGVKTTVEHPIAGTLDVVGNPIRLSATPITEYSAPPLLGEHTAEVLGERLGVTAQELEQLAARGVL